MSHHNVYHIKGTSQQTKRPVETSEKKGRGTMDVQSMKKHHKYE